MQNFKAQREEKKKRGKNTSGIVYGNVSNAATIYGEEKFHAIRGHGFAAERANNLYDRLTGHDDAHIVGDNNPKNGPDRFVDGVNIQSKYCSSGGKCISECFENGKFRYMNPDGTPMQIEVPHDKYDAAIQSMKNHISKGEVPGVSDIEEAKNIVRQGKFTYDQAKNIAKAGTVESLTYDAVNGTIIASGAFGITSILSFATSLWNGEDLDLAIKNAVSDGIKVGGVVFVNAILAGQFTKAGLNSFLVGSSESIIRIIGPKGSAVLANAFRNGTNIYGATAMKSAAKLLRSNVITGVASVVVISSFDVVNIFRGRISGGQLIKNVVGTTGTVAGGTVGWVGGVAAGAAIGSVVPLIGNAVGGFVGGLIGAFGGGSLAGKATNKIMDNFIEDDADKMVSIIESVFTELASEYLLTKNEVEEVVDFISKNVNGTDLKNMYASSDRENFVRMMLVPYIERMVEKRSYIRVPSRKDLQIGLKEVLEDIDDSEEYQKAFS